MVDMLPPRRLGTRVLLAFGLLVIMLLGLTQMDARGALLDPEGTELVDISACAGLYGHYTAVPGNVAHPVAAFNSQNVFIAYLSQSEDTWASGVPLNNPSRVVLTKYDGTNCTTPIQLTNNTQNPGNASHNAPSVFVDAKGYVYTTFGLGASDANNLNGPLMRRSVNPLNVSSFTPAQRLRLFQGAELNGFTMKNGNVMLTGTDMHGRFDILKPYNPSVGQTEYIHDHAQQVVTFGWHAQWSSTGNCQSNNFSKAVFAEGVGTDNNLYVIWGDGRGGAACNDEDYRHYTQDSHEVFFAYSEDGGETWKNLQGTQTRSAVDCYKHNNSWEADSSQPCRKNPYAGILVNDPAFRITSTRQREHREIWVHPDGTIYVAFAKSEWCDSGVCANPNTKVSTNPGALMMLSFRLGDSPSQVQEYVVDTNSHYFIGGIRRDQNDIYIWANRFQGGTIMEYKSSNGGQTWSATRISPASGVNGCNRMHGETYNPFLKNSVRIVFTCRVQNPEPAGNAYSHIFLYRRSFAHETTLPAGWQNEDVGGGQASGATSYWSDGTFLVHGAGADVFNNSDEFRFVHQQVSGDFEIVARVAEMEKTSNWAQAGIMIRETLDDDSKHAFLLARGGFDDGRFKRRTSTGGATSNTSMPAGVKAPHWLMLKRTGDTITAYTSPDGINWTEQASDTVAMNATVYAGMAVASYSSSVINTTTFDNVSILTSDWTNTDIGSPGITGSAAGAGGIFSVSGSGADIFGTADEFQYLYQTLTGDGEIVARVASISSVAGQSGVMMRESLDAGSKHAFANVRAIGGVTMKRRTSTDGSTANTTSTGPAAPHWVKLVRLGDTFDAYHSANGSSWTLIQSDTISMNQQIYVGLAVTSQNNGSLNTSVFDNVTVIEYAQAAWSSGDIGSVGIAGSGSETGGVFTVAGSGADVFGASDQFHYMYRTLSGNGTIEARVADIDGTGQSGIMMRETLGSDSKHAYLNIRAQGDTRFKSRDTTGGQTSNIAANGTSDPYWLRLVRSGNDFISYHSPDGVNWTLVGTVTISMDSEIYIGLAVTSQNNSSLNTSEFDNVSIY